MICMDRLRDSLSILIMFAIVLSLLSIYSNVYSVYRPVGSIVSNMFTFLCVFEKTSYLFEINVSFYSIWFINYVNPINISIRSLGPQHSSLLIRAMAMVDGVVSSRVLGYLDYGSILDSVLEMPLTSAAIKMSVDREVKQVRLDVYIDSFGCKFSTQLWVVLALSASSLYIDIDIDPNIAEVNRVIKLDIPIYNPSTEAIVGIDLYIYVNKSIVYMDRIDVLQPYDKKTISIEYNPAKPGLYVVEASAIYTSSSSPRETATAVAIFRAIYRSSLALYTNTSIANIGRAILLTGFIEPKTQDKKVIEIEQSIDGINWKNIARLEAIHSFNYTLTAQQIGIQYIRYRLIESQFLSPGTSNIISIAIEKVRPSITIDIDWPYINLGSKAFIKTKIDPPITDTIDILYKHENSTTWSKTTAKINKETSTIELQLDKPGAYEVKIKIPETPTTHPAESNTITVYVNQPKTQQTKTTQTQTQQTTINTTTIILITTATATAILLLAIKRK